MRRIYLDNAATSYPKPDSVLAAVDDYLRRLGAPAGRGVYREAAETERLVADARRRIADHLGVGQSSRIVFTGGCTEALNIALHGLLRPGDHVVTTVVEHNSVLRPLRFLEEQRNTTTTLVRCNGEGIVDPDDIRQAITPQTRLIVLNHVSNVTGAIQPAEAVGRIAAEHGVYFLLDAAQSLGYLPFTVNGVGAHLIAAPGHKGLNGLLGSGFLYVGPGLEDVVLPFYQGGTGTRSEDDHQPDSLPDRFEAGTHNVSAIVAMGAGMSYLTKTGLPAIRRQMKQLTERLLAGVQQIPGVRVYGPSDPDERVGIVSITMKGFDPHEAAAMLDSTYRIQARPGLQCAPRMHEALGTIKTGGTLRFSLGSSTMPEEIEKAVQALQEIASTAVV